MADAVVGALRIVLGADTAELNSQLEKASSRLEKFGKDLGFTASRIATAFAGVASAVALGVSKTIDDLDRLNKTSQKIGVPVEQLSAFEHAAELADVSTEAFSLSLVKLSKNMAATASGAEGPAAQAFAALGVQIEDSSGQLRSQADVLTDIAKKFATYEDSAEKTALAVALFGKAGAEMIPFLNQGAEGLARASEEAKKFGLIVSTEAAQAAEEFNDNLKRLQSINQGVWRTITTEALPALQKLSAALVTAASDTSKLETATSVTQKVINVTTGVVLAASAAYSIWTNSLALVAEAAKAVATLDLERLKKAFVDQGEANRIAIQQ